MIKQAFTAVCDLFAGAFGKPEFIEQRDEPVVLKTEFHKDFDVSTDVVRWKVVSVVEKCSRTYRLFKQTRKTLEQVDDQKETFERVVVSGVVAGVKHGERWINVEDIKVPVVKVRKVGQLGEVTYDFTRTPRIQFQLDEVPSKNHIADLFLVTARDWDLTVMHRVRL